MLLHGHHSKLGGMLPVTEGPGKKTIHGPIEKTVVPEPK